MTAGPKNLFQTPRKLIFWVAVIGFAVLAAYMAFFLRSGEQRHFQSAILAEERTYSVYLPAGYNTGERYPVLYSLDGEKYRHGAIVAANARMMAAFGLAPEMIVVAVHTMGKRGRDYRPSFGAETFASFLESELIPQIEQPFSVSDARVLSGHSFGGLFTLYAMTTRPHLFEAYFAYDPSVLRDELLLNRLGQLSLLPNKKPIRLYMNYGFHTDWYERRYDEMLQLLETKMAGQVDAASSYYPLPHSMIMVPGQVEALWFAHHQQ